MTHEETPEQERAGQFEPGTSERLGKDEVLVFGEKREVPAGHAGSIPCPERAAYVLRELLAELESYAHHLALEFPQVEGQTSPAFLNVVALGGAATRLKAHLCPPEEAERRAEEEAAIKAADLMRAIHRDGILRATSVGFRCLPNPAPANPNPDRDLAWSPELCEGDRMRDKQDHAGGWGTIEVCYERPTGSVGIRWDNHKERGFDPNHLDVFSGAATFRLLEREAPE